MCDACIVKKALTDYLSHNVEVSESAYRRPMHRLWSLYILLLCSLHDHVLVRTFPQMTTVPNERDHRSSILLHYNIIGFIVLSLALAIFSIHE